jgi:hypothetical protein
MTVFSRLLRRNFTAKIPSPSTVFPKTPSKNPAKSSKEALPRRAIFSANKPQTHHPPPPADRDIKPLKA